MNIIMLIIGAVIFGIFILATIWETTTEVNDVDETVGYYARHQPDPIELEEMSGIDKPKYSKESKFKLDAEFNDEQIDRIIEMAWEDRTTFEAIEFQFGIKENGVRKIMRTNLKNSSFKLWRERVKGRSTKHQKKSLSTRFKSQNQKY